MMTPYQRRCFIIGPMGDMARLSKIRNEVICPLLEPLNFKVITPEEGLHENIMRQVLLSLEQADILIADISGHNPNVMYELGIYHSFGKPYIIVNDRAFKTDGSTTPFDIASYRFVEIDLNDIAFSIQAVQERLAYILEQMDKRDWFGNPVTDFYQSPVAEIPTATGLSKNYVRNFLKLLIPDIFLRNENNDNYQIDIWIQTDNGKSKYRKLKNGERQSLQFEVLVPVRLDMAEHQFIRGLKGQQNFAYTSARVVRRAREFNMHMRVNDEGAYVLADIPTVLSTLNDAIRQRRVIHQDLIGSADWEVLENQELKRFIAKCASFFKEQQNLYPECKGKLKLNSLAI